jgi:hypothetical protein
VGHQFEIGSAERVALAGGEISERHLVAAGDFGVQVMNLAGESIRRKPLGHCVRIEERPINSLRRCPKHSVKSDGVYFICWHSFLCVVIFIICDEESRRFRTCFARESARTIANLAAMPSPQNHREKNRKNPRSSAESPSSSDRLDLESVSVSIGERLNLAANRDYGMADRLRPESPIRACEKLAFQDAGIITDRNELHDSTVHLMMQPGFDDHTCNSDPSCGIVSDIGNWTIGVLLDIRLDRAGVPKRQSPAIRFQL